MNGEEVIFLGIAGAAFLVALVLSYFFGKRRNKLGLTIMGLLWAGFTGILFFGMYNANGWDAIGYAIFLIGASAPIGLGGLIGSLVGWAKSGNEQYEESSHRAGQTDTATVSR